MSAKFERSLIFDLDGTLADTLPTIAEAVNMCMEHFNLPKRSRQQVREAVGNGVAMLIRRSLPNALACDEEAFAAILAYFNECYGQTYHRVEGCYAGLYEVILELKAMGYGLAVLSNKPDAFVKGIVEKLFGNEVFFAAVGQTDLPKKPDPTVALMLLDRLGTRPENAYFIGDSDVDVLTARNAGMHPIGVSWGFRDREALSGAEFIADDPAMLADHLRMV